MATPIAVRHVKNAAPPGMILLPVALWSADSATGSKIIGGRVPGVTPVTISVILRKKEGVGRAISVPTFGDPQPYWKPDQRYQGPHQYV